MRIRVSMIRFLLEAGFLVLVAAAAGLAQLSALWIGVVMFGAWLLVAFVERSGARGARRPHRREAEPEPEPEPAPTAAAKPEAQVQPPAPEPKLEAEPVLVAVPPPEPEPEPELEPEPEVVPLVLRDQAPRTWNLWELERIAHDRRREPALDEERALLVLHLREFANASGDLPVEFDPLVREAFGADLAELSATRLA